MPRRKKEATEIKPYSTYEHELLTFIVITPEMAERDFKYLCGNSFTNYDTDSGLVAPSADSVALRLYQTTLNKSKTFTNPALIAGKGRYKQKRYCREDSYCSLHK